MPLCRASLAQQSVQQLMDAWVVWLKKEDRLQAKQNCLPHTVPFIPYFTYWCKLLSTDEGRLMSQRDTDSGVFGAGGVPEVPMGGMRHFSTKDSSPAVPGCSWPDVTSYPEEAFFSPLSAVIVTIDSNSWLQPIKPFWRTEEKLPCL